MKKIISVFACTLIIIAAFAIFSETQTKLQENTNLENSQVYFTSNATSSQESSNIPAMTEKNEESYTVKIHENKIGVFRGTEESPFEIIPVNVSDLPQTDRLLLAKGLHAENLTELRAILEDYES